jgi:hypothetical protein
MASLNLALLEVKTFVNKRELNDTEKEKGTTNTCYNLNSHFSFCLTTFSSSYFPCSPTPNSFVGLFLFHQQQNVVCSPPAPLTSSLVLHSCFSTNPSLPVVDPPTVAQGHPAITGHLYRGGRVTCPNYATKVKEGLLKQFKGYEKSGKFG